MNEFFLGFKKIDSECYWLHNKSNRVEYYNSITECIQNGIFYKIIDDFVFLIKPVNVMNNYSLILYATPYCIHGKREYDMNANADFFTDNKVTIRNSTISTGKKDFGCEYLYDCKDFIEMKGGNYHVHRKILNRLIPDISIVNDLTVEASDIVERWTANKGVKHQLRFFKTIIKNRNNLKLSTVFYKELPVGISVVEDINEKFSCGIFTLINPIQEVYDLREPNFIMHYAECLQNIDRHLNFGSGAGVKGIDIAKKKLKPYKTLDVNRLVPKNKITKEEFHLFKNN